MFDNKITCCYLYVITKYGYPPPAEQTLNYIREMKDLGFRSIELEGIREKHLLQMYNIRFDIKELIRELELSVPYFCTVLPGLSSAEKSERKHNLKIFEKGCDVARELGSKGVLDNGPLPPYQFPDSIPVTRHYDEHALRAAQFPPHLNWKKYWADLIDTFRTVCDIAADYGLTYQVHPALGILTATTDGFLRFYDSVNQDNMRFNFDTANQFALKDNLMLSLRKLKGMIDYIHISDNGGEKIEHLTPGDGKINWDLFFETLKIINFEGHFGLDIGGDESGVGDIDAAYRTSAEWLENFL